MTVKITNIEKDLPLLNRALEQLATLQADHDTVKSNVAKLNVTLQNFVHLRDAVSTNNVVFMWSGASSTVSWAAAYVKDTLGVTHPIPAGTSQVLSPSTAYWAAWNPEQGTMSFETSLATYSNFPNLIVLSNIQTGTSGGSGSIGGGGTDPGGGGPGGKQYF